MAQYDLGTARGQVQIDFDSRGVDRALSALDQTQNKGNSVTRGLSDLGQALRDLFDATGAAIADAFGGGGADKSGVGEFSSKLTGDIGKAADTVKGYFNDIANSAKSALGNIESANLSNKLAAGFLAARDRAQEFYKDLAAEQKKSENVFSNLGEGGGSGAIGSIATGASTAVKGIFDLGHAVSNYLGNIAKVAGESNKALGVLIQFSRVGVLAASGVAALDTGLGLLGGAVQLVGGIGQALVQLTGLIGLIPGAIAGAAAAFAVFKIAINGMAAAIKLASDQGQADLAQFNAHAANSAQDMAHAVDSAKTSVQQALTAQATDTRNSATQIQLAQRAVRDAHEQAAVSIQTAVHNTAQALRELNNAERDQGIQAAQSAFQVEQAQRTVATTYQDAQRSVANAQQAVINANNGVAQSLYNLQQYYKQAIRSVEDLQTAQRKGALDAESAQINYKEALLNQQYVDKNLISTQLDKEKAALQVKQAQEQITEVQQQSTRTTQDLTTAQGALSNSYQPFIDAKKAVTDANLAFQNSELDLQKTISDSANAEVVAKHSLNDAIQQQSIGAQDASQRIIDATYAYANAERDLPRTIRDANEKIADSARSLADTEITTKNSATQASISLANAQYALDKAYRDQKQAADDNANALKKMTGAYNPIGQEAQKLATALAAILNQYNDLVQVVQNKIFVHVADEIQILANTYLPVLETGLGNVATEFNHIGIEFLRWLGQKDQVNTIATILQQVATVIHNMGLSLIPFVDAFLRIATVGLSSFGSLTNGIGNVATRFDDFIKRVQASGQLKTWIDNGIQGLKDLIRFLYNLGAILKDVFEGLTGASAGGGNFLAFLADGTEKIKKFLESAKGQDDLRAIGTFLHDSFNRTLETLKDLLPSVIELIKALAPVFASAAASVHPVLTSALTILSVVLPPIAAILKTLAPILGPVVAVLAIFGLSVAAITRIFKPFLDIFKGAQTAFKVFEKIKTIVTDLEGFKKALELAKTALNAIKLAILENPWVLLAIALALVVYEIVKHWDAIKKTVLDALNAIGDFFKKNWRTILELFTGPIGPLIVYVIDHWNQIKQTFFDALHAIEHFFTDTIPHWFDAVRDFFGNIIDTAHRGFDEFVGFFEHLGERIFGALNRLGGDLFNAGRNLIQNLINGVRALINDVGNAAHDVVQAIRNFFPFSPAKEGPLSGKGSLDVAGSNMMQNLIDGIQSRNDDIAASMTTVGDTINKALPESLPIPTIVIPQPKPPTIPRFPTITIPATIKANPLTELPTINVDPAVTALKAAATSLADTTAAMVGGSAGIATAIDAAFVRGRTALGSTTVAQQVVTAATLATSTRPLITSPGIVPLQTTTNTAPQTNQAPASTITVANLNLNIAGNLDPTDPVRYRIAINNIRDAIRSLEKSR